MVSRAGKKIKWDMLNGSTIWMDPATKRNVDKIYLFLDEITKKAELEKKRKPKYSFSKISKKTGVTPKSVGQACMRLAFCEKPVIRIHRDKIWSQKSNCIFIIHNVELIRFIEQ